MLIQYVWILICIIILMYICRYEYASYMFYRQKNLGRLAKQAAALADVNSKHKSHPDAKYFADVSAFAANQASTADSYADAVKYYNYAIEYSNKSMALN